MFWLWNLVANSHMHKAHTRQKWIWKTNATRCFKHPLAARRGSLYFLAVGRQRQNWVIAQAPPKCLICSPMDALLKCTTKMQYITHSAGHALHKTFEVTQLHLMQPVPQWLEWRSSNAWKFHAAFMNWREPIKILNGTKKGKNMLLNKMPTLFHITNAAYKNI